MQPSWHEFAIHFMHTSAGTSMLFCHIQHHHTEENLLLRMSEMAVLQAYTDILLGTSELDATRSGRHDSLPCYSTTGSKHPDRPLSLGQSQGICCRMHCHPVYTSAACKQHILRDVLGRQEPTATESTTSVTPHGSKG